MERKKVAGSDLKLKPQKNEKVITMQQCNPALDILKKFKYVPLFSYLQRYKSIIRFFAL
jgi:hypothetical protein